jgi:hypothetical protein
LVVLIDKFEDDFIVMSNLTNDQGFTLHQELWKPYLQYRVLIRQNLIKMTVLEKLPLWLDDIFPNLLYDLCLLWALDVSDMHLSNILIHPEQKKVYIIDYDETRSHKDNYSLYPYFTKEP